MLEAIFDYAFLRNAFIAALLSSIVCGIIGTIIVEKRLVMMSGGIAHTSFGGIGLGYYLNFEPIFGGLLFAVLSSMGIVYIKRNGKGKSDAIIGMFWSLGMALGILFISLTPGYPPSLTSYLFGDILRVSNFDITLMSILDIIIVISFFGIFNYWKAYLFDEEYSKVIGINTTILEYFLFILISFSIVVLIRVVGIILVIALLTIPTSIAKLYSNDLKMIMILSIIIGAIMCFVGLIMSYNFDIQSGATIIIVSTLCYIISAFINGKVKKKKKYRME
ncbi:metal ABC transporter permease [Oceanirhabdus sp. W0125-5]|uniref:metal ABC transporter permease n=1 Tax=Oceanirhabdus sp. W0125-5 TaxID=2999116 RepID=UPI0022F2DFB1|nr:metal ABC transporter permease [Oceanirhabdus sp. W0125-5]WBW97358.1 metal ABC transporter permease [Oceanirhabdus sp. W0125-5]